MIKTIGDINRFIDKLQYNMWEIPTNLELKIKLSLNDYISIQKEFQELAKFSGQLSFYNTWITYQYMGIKTTIILETT